MLKKSSFMWNPTHLSLFIIGLLVGDCIKCIKTRQKNEDMDQIALGIADLELLCKMNRLITMACWL